MLGKVEMNQVINHSEIANQFINDINERGTVHAKLISSYIVDGDHHIDYEFTFKETLKMINIDPKIFEKEIK